jgi:hypothetical protein
VASPQDYEDLLGTISLHIDWRGVTRHMTTEQRELFADAVEAWSKRLDPEEPWGPPRWWRGDFRDVPGGGS